MEKILRFTERLCRISVWLCGFLLLGTVFLIGVEVILRKFFGVTMGGADEISSYVLALVCTWSLGYTLFQKGHVRIDILHDRLSPKIQIILDLLALAAFLLYMLFVNYFAFIALKTSIIRNSVANTPLQTPLWIPQSLWFLGLVSFTLIIVLIILGTTSYVLRGDLNSARNLAGTSSAEVHSEEAIN
ncbi:MAG: TRAP transporter small permease [Desulfovermiculus sp.]|nr:TRAP transporter small permease [Desulfovermiculus sp.]